ncbi:hypothetical protein PBI_QUEENHAZEL_18 [Mycobacterium phage QueenHazel]|nr:hypothetical protein PBI_QUEENHAZEL_18 [Mycobacterium phage QueenHazel]
MAMQYTLWTGEPQLGLWCPKCLKPSGYRVPLYHVTLAGVTNAGAVDRCYAHGGPLQ